MNRRTPRPLSEDNLRRALTNILIDDPRHLDDETIAAWAERISVDGWKVLDTEEIDRHLLQCEQCFESVAAVVDMLETEIGLEGSPPQVDLSFLGSSALWEKTSDGLRTLDQTILVQVQQARLELVDLMSPLLWTPSLAGAATRGAEDQIFTSAQSGTITVPLPDVMGKVELKITGTPDGMNLIIDISPGIDMDELEADLFDHREQEDYRPLRGPKQLGFGELLPGRYDLRITYQGLALRIPLEVK